MVDVDSGDLSLKAGSIATADTAPAWVEGADMGGEESLLRIRLRDILKSKSCEAVELIGNRLSKESKKRPVLRWDLVG